MIQLDKFIISIALTFRRCREVILLSTIHLAMVSKESFFKILQHSWMIMSPLFLNSLRIIQRVCLLLIQQGNHNLKKMNYRDMYEQKSKECQELNEQLCEFQEQSNLIINDLESEIKEVKRKNQNLTREIQEHKDKNKLFKSTIEREVELAQKERNQFKKKFIQFQKKVIELEIVNENLESELRATKSVLAEYQSRTEKTMEELAIVQLQFQETNENNKEQVTRLKNQLKDTEEELYALHNLKQKKEEIKQSNHSQLCTSQVASSNPNLFKQTLKGIRQYLSTIDNRKAQIRNKFILKT